VSRVKRTQRINTMSTEKSQSESAQRRELEPNEVPLATLDVGDIFSFNGKDPRYELIDTEVPR